MQEINIIKKINIIFPYRLEEAVLLDSESLSVN